MTISISIPPSFIDEINRPVTITAQVTSSTPITLITWESAQRINFTVSLDHKSIRFVPSVNGTYNFRIVVRAGAEQKIAETVVNVGAPPQVPPAPPVPGPIPQGTVIYDSHLNSKLHNGIVRRFTAEGNLECRASGSPYIQVNNDGTFSLWDSDLGRFYLYVNNYNVMMELDAAFWTNAGQTLSLKLRSRHNEGGDCSNRFGGYGSAIKQTSFDKKRETCHNNHDESVNGPLGITFGYGRYHHIQYSVKDLPKPTEVLVLDGRRIYSYTDQNPAPYMINQPLYMKRSYIWVRQNTSKLAELRIKSLRLIAI